MFPAGLRIPDEDVRELITLVDEPTRSFPEKSLALDNEVVALTVEDRERILWALDERRVVATRTGPSAREVALDYARSLGYKRDEIIYYGLDGVCWRGAVYRAQLVKTNAA